MRVVIARLPARRALDDHVRRLRDDPGRAGGLPRRPPARDAGADRRRPSRARARPLALLPLRRVHLRTSRTATSAPRGRRSASATTARSTASRSGTWSCRRPGSTGSVILGGAVVLVLIAVPLALISARVPRSILDRAVVAISLIGISTHPLVIGARAAAALQRALAPARRRLLQPSRTGPPRSPALSSRREPSRRAAAARSDWATHLILPWITFALFFVALYMRVLRARLLETLAATTCARRVPRARASPACSCATRCRTSSRR